MNDRVTITRNGGVADVRLNRPEKLNALDQSMFHALIEAGEELKADSSVRAVVLSGEGRSFCAGLDLASFSAMASGELRGDNIDGEARAPRDTAVYDTAQAVGQQAVYVWREIPAPVIGAIRGHALGGGFQLALGADIRIVAPDARMSVLEVRWGLIPDMTGTQLLPQLVGLERAKELAFTGRIISGEEAVAMGLASQLHDEPVEAALELAAELAMKSPDSLRGSKHLLNLAGTVSLAEGFAEEQRVIRSLIGTPNQIESVTAYFEKRNPNFADPTS